MGGKEIRGEGMGERESERVRVFVLVHKSLESV